ncbi:hypothetical protein J1605_015259 [Eschrichtius robustus]|uniref:Uncharacterized protein n=1 Tax=Eschrichtius robustus TaxID=9764 RepID=A0AB34GDN2_ESCRO|nr:hypothetical protein J1605_015259 [Eschrichtius robustus]
MAGVATVVTYMSYSFWCQGWESQASKVRIGYMSTFGEPASKSASVSDALWSDPIRRCFPRHGSVSHQKWMLQSNRDHLSQSLRLSVIPAQSLVSLPSDCWFLEESAPGVGAQLQSSRGREGGGSDFQPGDQPPMHVLGRRGFSLIARDETEGVWMGGGKRLQGKRVSKEKAAAALLAPGPSPQQGNTEQLSLTILRGTR